MTNEKSDAPSVTELVRDVPAGSTVTFIGDDPDHPFCLKIVVPAKNEQDARARPKYERVDFEMAYKNFPEGDDIYSLGPHDRGRIEGYNRAIDDIKSKYGDLWAEVKK